MSLVLPESMNYKCELSYLPEIISQQTVIVPSNQSTFTDNQQVFLDIPRANFLDPHSVMLRYRLNFTTTGTATGTGNGSYSYIRGLPAVTPISRLETSIGSTTAQSISYYNQYYAMMMKLKLNMAQRAASGICFGILHSSATAADPETLVNLSGYPLPQAAGTTVISCAIPLYCLLSSTGGKLFPLEFSNNVRITLTMDQISNMVFLSSGQTISSWSMTNVELCLQTIRFPTQIVQMQRELYPNFFIKCSSVQGISQSVQSGTSGLIENVYAFRQESIRSLLLSCVTNNAYSQNYPYDSWDVCSSSATTAGTYQFFIDSVPYPARPLDASLQKSGVMLALLDAVQAGYHGAETYNHAIADLEWNGSTYSSGNTTSCGQLAQFFVGVSTEKLTGMTDAVLTGVSAKNSNVTVRINIGTSTTVAYQCILFAIHDLLLSYDLVGGNVTVQQ